MNKIEIIITLLISTIAFIAVIAIIILIIWATAKKIEAKIIKNKFKPKQQISRKNIYNQQNELKQSNQKENIYNQQTELEQTTQKENIYNQQEEIYPYHKKYLLTKNEYYFYNRLKNITEPLNLQILAKIRLADLIETNSGLNKSQQSTYFNKIKAKHIDFAIANNMKIILIIELDDYSHSYNSTKERDSFVNNALIKSGYTVVRTNGNLDVISKALIDKGYNKNLYTNTNYYK